MDMFKVPEDSSGEMDSVYEFVKAELKRRVNLMYAHQFACCEENCVFCEGGYPLGALPTPEACAELFRER